MKTIWTREQDIMLAEAVLRHIREGSSAINAFDEVGSKLNRSAATCGYRWNNAVRFDYKKAILNAKKNRYELKYRKAT